MKFFKNVIPYVIILAVVILIRTFIATPVIVDGESMNDTLHNNEILLLKKYDKSYDRFDIIVFNYEGTRLVKRIIGMPGETIKYVDGTLYINGEEVEDAFASLTNDYYLSYQNIEVIPEGYYFVMGDNRKNSVDSRIIGLVSEDRIKGITNFSIWPFKTIK